MYIGLRAQCLGLVDFYPASPPPHPLPPPQSHPPLYCIVIYTIVSYDHILHYKYHSRLESIILYSFILREGGPKASLPQYESI